MSPAAINQAETEELITEIQSARKYRHLEIPRETILDLIIQEADKYKRYKEVRQAVKAKLHQIVAPYLGDPDYELAQIEMERAFASTPQGLLDFCHSMLKSHSSTRERLTQMELFYERIFQITGMPSSIMDLACGLHPFSIPWMHLPQTTSYHAYDLHRPRVKLIRNFLDLYHQPGEAVYDDILLHPPKIQADIAFFLKEAHRFDQRRHDSNRQFFQQLSVNYLVVSLPANSLTGRHDKIKQHQRLVYDAVSEQDWPIEQFQVDTELVFILKKGL